MIDTYKKLFEILPPADKWRFAALFLLMLLGTAFEVVGIGMIPVFISALTDPAYILESEILGPVAAAIGIENSRDLLIWGGTGLVAIFVVKGADNHCDYSPVYNGRELGPLYLVQDGKVLEQGTYAELNATNAQFQKMSFTH